MTQQSTTKAGELLAAALQGAADVARGKLEREVTVAESALPTSAAILRFDLTFAQGGRLSWFVTNEDATGFSDILCGGVGDRGTVLTEMHLDALTVAFSDMLTRAVDTMSSNLTQALESGEIDLGMEQSVPDPEHGGEQVVLALEIAGFGAIPVVQQANADLAQILEHYALATISTPAVAPAAPASAAQAPAAEAPPAPAGPVPVDNVVRLQSPVPAEPARRTADLDMLMNVPLPLTVELGRTQRTVRELVGFSVGSIIELGKLAGDPLDIMVNDRVIARGEVVVIDEEFGIRVTEIISPDDRLRGLG